MKMAAASLCKDIDDNFCLCSICLEQFKEPKLLPCLHRFCKDCLEELLKGSSETLKCPECREEVQIPTNGTDGFKTDFYMRNLVEYVQIQQSLQSNKMRECYSCSKHLSASAFCFKCNNFLCKDCHHAHVTSKVLKDHKPHTLSVEDIESKSITPEKLASMRDAPRCHVHPSKLSELYCETCYNVPVCVACMFGKHKGHDLQEVTELAGVKKKLLAERLIVLDEMNADSKVMAPSKMREKLIQNVTSEKQNLQNRYEDKLKEQEVNIEDIKRKIEDLNTLKKNEKQTVYDTLQKELDREIQEVKNKYKDMYDTKENEINDKFCTREKCLEKQLAKSSQRLEQLDKDKKELLKSIELQLKEKVQIIETTVEHFEKVSKRFENLTVMASNILASENDWMAVECIPDLYAASTTLMKDLRKEFPETETLINVKIDYQQFYLGKPNISKVLEQVEKKVPIDDACYYFNGATSSGDGNIVVTGWPRRGNEAFIIVIDVSGKIVKQKKLNTGGKRPWHVCDFLPQHKVALAYAPNTIGVYNVGDGSYFECIISNVITSWPVVQTAACVATNPANNHILLGRYDSRDVYVFDDRLNYLHILTLPEMIKWPRHMTVSDDHLLICDFEGKKAYVTTMEVSENKLLSEFIKPDVGVINLKPRSVCTDKDGFVYILWTVLSRAQCYLVQYNHDGNQILTTKKLDEDARVISAVETPQGEKVFVATYNTQTVYLYNLIEED